MIFEPFDAVAVPFPFTESMGHKKRPAVVLSKKPFNNQGHSVLCMITTKSHSPWPGDIIISDYKSAGLHVPCCVRLKIFTLDNRLIIKKIGHLIPADRNRVTLNLERFIF